MKIDYTIISTGSKGNAVLIGDSILIDCGVPFKSIAKHKGALRLVLLTHSHGDHFNPTTIARLADERPTLRFACGEWLVNALVLVGVSKQNIDVLAGGHQYTYRSAAITPFEVLHDVPNFGYKVELADGGKVLYVTDAGNLNGTEAPDYDLYMIEGDYDEDEIDERISDKKASGAFVYEHRVKKYHLSKSQCVDFVLRNGNAQSEFVYLHQHQEDGK